MRTLKQILPLCILVVVSIPGLAQSGPGSFQPADTATIDLNEPIRGFRRDSIVDSEALYWASVSALVTTTTLDHYSSIGKYERNPVLSMQDGRYNAGRGAALKYGTAAGLIVLQRYTLRKHPKLRWAATAANFALSAWFGTVAAVNYSR